MNTLKGYFWWTYDRGSLHYDIMVTLILLFLFVGPHYIDFKDKPAPVVPFHASEVLVKHAFDGGNRMTFEVKATDVGQVSSDEERREALLRVIEPIAGPVSLKGYTPLTDTHGAVVAYDAVVTR